MRQILFISLVAICLSANAQKPVSKGKLFIIGGGDRATVLIQSLIATAALTPNDYAIVLPMASENPDTAFYYFKNDLEQVCHNPVINFNFTREKINDQNWLDSLSHARLIFITGGDQDRFMKAVIHTPVYTAIHKAYQDGATIGGTSAGAAVMCKYMITGNELSDTSYHPTFPRIRHNNIEIKEGLGLLTKTIIDQHFITRSRYNRLFSALAQYPSYNCIGIDEGTAIIVNGNKLKVTGTSQVILIRNPKQLKITSTGLIQWEDIQFSIYTHGDQVQF